jgi:hypothetical protein
MEAKGLEKGSPHSLKKLNNGRKKKINMDEWKDTKTKKIKDARKAYIAWKGKQVKHVHQSR